MSNLVHIQWGEYGNNPRIYRGWGGGLFPPGFPPPKPTMTFCKIMLLASKDRGDMSFQEGLMGRTDFLDKL